MPSQCPILPRQHLQQQVKEESHDQPAARCPMGFDNEELTKMESPITQFTCSLCQCFLFEAVTFFPCVHSFCKNCVHAHERMVGQIAQCPVLHQDDDAASGLVCYRCGKSATDSRTDPFRQHMTNSYMDTEWINWYEELQMQKRRDSAEEAHNKGMSDLRASLIDYLSKNGRKVSDLVASLQRREDLPAVEEKSSSSTMDWEERISIVDMQLTRAMYYFRESLRSGAPENPFANVDAAIARADKARKEIEVLWKDVFSKGSPDDRLQKYRDELCNLIGVISGNLASLFQLSHNTQKAQEEYQRSCDDLHLMLYEIPEGREGSKAMNLAIAQSLSTSLVKFGDFSLYIAENVESAIKCYEENLKIKECVRSQQQQLTDGILDIQDNLNLIGSILKFVEALKKDQQESHEDKIHELLRQADTCLHDLEERHDAHLQSSHCEPMLKQQFSQVRQLIDQYMA